MQRRPGESLQALWGNVKNHRALRFSPLCGLASQQLQFHGCWQKKRDPGSQTKGFIVYKTMSNMNLMAAWFSFSSSSHGATQVGLSRCRTHCRGPPSSGKQNLFYGSASKLVQLWPSRYIHNATSPVTSIAQDGTISPMGYYEITGVSKGSLSSHPLSSCRRQSAASPHHHPLLKFFQSCSTSLSHFHS